MGETIYVKAAAGREVPLHSGDYAAPGGGHSVLKGDEVIEVASSPGIRRRIRSGDLVQVTGPAVGANTGTQIAPATYAADSARLPPKKEG